MGRELYDRRASVLIGPRGEQGKKWADLRFQFTVKKTPKGGGNSLELTIFNLSPDSREWIEQGMVVDLTAGYAKNTQGIFIGEIKRVKTKGEGTSQDIKTVVEAGDGVGANQKPMNQSLAPGATAENVLGKITDAMGDVDISEGFTTAMNDIADKANGATLQKAPAEELNDLLAGQGKEWSIQDGNLEIIEEGGTAGAEVISLSPESGLISAQKMGDGEGDKVKVEAFLMGRILPNRKINVDGKQVSGTYKSGKVTHTGDTHGQDWKTTFEGKP